MSDLDPYKHIRALAESIPHIAGQIVTEEVLEDAPALPKVDIDKGIVGFATALRAERERRGLTQRELGGMAGVPQSHISKIESGAVDLRLSSLLALARVLNLELALSPRERPAAADPDEGAVRAAAGVAPRHADLPVEEVAYRSNSAQ